jgi:hypothetical protein
VHGFAIYRSDVRRRKTLGGKVIAVEGLDGNRGGRGREGAQEIDEELGGSRRPVWERGSSFDVIPSFIARRRQRIPGLGLGLGHDGPASQGGLRSGGHQ